MFIVKHLENEAEDRFETRDQLLAFLDTANARSRQEQSKETLNLIHLDQDGKPLEQTNISLPMESAADAYLINFGKLKDKSGFPFPRRPSVTHSNGVFKESPKEIPLKNDKQDVRKAVSAPEKEKSERKSVSSTSSRPSLVVFLLFLFWILGTAALGYGFYQEKETAQILISRISQLETLQNETPAIDAFSRFFLPNYFTGNQDYFSDYLSKRLQKKSLETQTGTLQSVILEKLTTGKTGYRVSYILVVKAEDDSRKTIRLTFTVKAASKATHGYEVISVPKSSKYPK